MTRRQTGIGLALVTGGSLAVLWLTKIPLGVPGPGEWTWSRIPFDVRDWPALLLGCGVAVVVGGLHLGLAGLAARRIEDASRGETAAWLAALCVVGFMWLWAVQESPARIEHSLAKTGWVLYYPATEGYFHQARYEMTDVRSYLRDYERRMAEGEVFHIGTHPPGLMLFHRACLALCASSPELRAASLRTQPASFREALDVTNEIERKAGRHISPTDRAAIWLAALVTQAVAVCTLVPLFLLVRRTFPRTASWWAAALWPLIPALAIFLPKSDALFPFIGMLFLWTWLEGFFRDSLFLSLLAGVIFWFGMFLSLAILPVAIAAGLLTLWETRACRPAQQAKARPRDVLLRFSAVLAGWAAPTLFMWLAFQINLLSVWAWNYRNHGAFYNQYSRTYWKWLLANPFELVFAVGAPVIFAAAVGFRRTVAAGWRSRDAGPYWCLSAAWLVLLLSGKNMGEAARLWLVIMPWPVWLAAGFLSRPTGPCVPNSGRELNDRTQITWLAIALMLSQLAVCLGTVTRVTGFDFPTMPVD